MTNNEQRPVDNIRDCEHYCKAKELVEIILSFTKDQLEDFLNDPITVSILRPEAATVSDLPEVS